MNIYNVKEIDLLRKIADEAKRVWDSGGLRIEAGHLKNLLTDRIDWDNRHNSTED